MGAPGSNQEIVDRGQSDPGHDAGKDTDPRRHDHIALEAYYNAQRRGFAHGSDLEDWLAAEKSIDLASDGNAAPADGDVADARDRIEPEQVHAWAKKMDVSEDRLREAIQRVGPERARVAEFLGDPGAN